MAEEREDIQKLEERVEELERLADSLADVPEEDLVEVLGRAVNLLREVNAGMERGLRSAGGEARELGNLLDGLGFGPFDEALREIEKKEREESGGTF